MGTGPVAAAGATPGDSAGRRFRFELAAHPGSPAQARRLTRARLTGWAVGEDTCDAADLVVSELVTNAIVHTASELIVCELHDEVEKVRIAVRDEGCAPGEPRPSPQRPEEEHGRGLLLVAAVASAWGAHETEPGLLVWAELPRAEQSAGQGTGKIASPPHARDAQTQDAQIPDTQAHHAQAHHAHSPQHHAQQDAMTQDAPPRDSESPSTVATGPEADGAVRGTGAEWV
ncbi:ATP-binding protein [Streptomyces sp. NPDC091292]|uniref:ATP-binding protein n=1 Tax=Streptomyces sp. NPDC091292 TaxID=3365991 RepID=UPI00380BA8BA